MKTITKFDLLKARLQVTQFYDNLNDTQKKECLKALIYAGVPIKELKKEFTINKSKTLKSILKRFILSDLFIKVFVYSCAFILTLLLTLEI